MMIKTVVLIYISNYCLIISWQNNEYAVRVYYISVQTVIRSAKRFIEENIYRFCIIKSVLKIVTYEVIMHAFC